LVADFRRWRLKRLTDILKGPLPLFWNVSKT
jgi:hypothetical protein